MKKAVSFLRNARDRVFERPYLYGGIVVVLLLGWWMFGGTGNGKDLQTMVLTPTDFAPAVAVSGTVVAAQEVDLGFAQSGRVSGVYVKVGSEVGAGTTIANIENGDERAALASAQARLQEALAGTRPEEIHIAEVEVENAKAEALDAVREAFRAADDAVRTKTTDLFNNPTTNPSLTFITDSQSSKRTAEDGRLALEHELDVWEREVLALNSTTDLSAALTRASAVLGQAAPFLTAVATALNNAVQDAYNTQAEIEASIANITTARTTISNAQSGITSARSGLESAQRSLALQQAGSTSYDIAYERAQVESAQAALARTVITAPFSGTISRVDVHVGEIISPNTSEISMLSRGVFQIESYVPEVNIANIEVGDSAAVTLDAYGAETFAATIASIDPAETVKDGVSTYKTTLQFTTEDPRIRSGMTANITITTEQKFGVLIVPQGAIVRRSGNTFVQILSDKEVIERQVTTGATSLGQVEILSGVAAGEMIVLNPQ